MTRDQATKRTEGTVLLFNPQNVRSTSLQKSKINDGTQPGKFPKLDFELCPLWLRLERIKTIEMGSFCRLLRQQPNQSKLKLYLETLEIQSCRLTAQYWRALCHTILCSCGKAYLLYP